MSEISETAHTSKFSADTLAFYSFLLLVFSVGFMQPSAFVFKYYLPVSDLIFLVTFFFWFVALLFRKAKFRWHKFYWFLVFYFASMVISTIFSIDPRSSFVKLLGETYLLGLAILTFNFVRNEKQAKQVIYAWLAATIICVLIGVVSLFLFYFDPDNWLLAYTKFHFGTLPPGNYLRLQSTFLNANMLCNYLSVSLMMLLVSLKLGWINKLPFVFAFIGIMVCSLLTISPGIGGIALSLGIWFFIYKRGKKRSLAFASLLCGIALSTVFYSPWLSRRMSNRIHHFTSTFP